MSEGQPDKPSFEDKSSIGKSRESIRANSKQYYADTTVPAMQAEKEAAFRKQLATMPHEQELGKETHSRVTF